MDNSMVGHPVLLYVGAICVMCPTTIKGNNCKNVKEKKSCFGIKLNEVILRTTFQRLKPGKKSFSGLKLNIIKYRNPPNI